MAAAKKRTKKVASARKAPAKSKAPAASKRRKPITRAEGEQRLIDATIALTQTTPISEVGVRDIARAADVNHGFVHTWFGSKNDLLVAAVRKLTIELAEETAREGPNLATPFHPKVQLVVKLLMWLFLEDFETGGVIADGAFVDALAGRYMRSYGLDPETAHTAAQQGAAIGIATVILGDVVGATSKDAVQRILDLWVHSLGLLGKYPPA